MTTPAHNPIIPGFHPDPSICRVGADFYLVCSSFEYWPALPLFHSRDLVNWRLIGHAIDRPSQFDLTSVPSSLGFMAPTIRHHEGRFWIAGTVVLGGENFIISASDPAGPWSEPVRVDLPGIDPDLAWDEQGRCRWTSAGISQAVIDHRTGEVLEPPSVAWSGSDDASWPEAPHLYFVNGFWYLMIAEGGTERAHAVAIARSSSPAGPFEPCPHNPILTHRGRNRSIQNTGHGDLVQLPNGDCWMVLLGVRPTGMTPHFHVLGRETFLTRVTWRDGWPAVDPVQETFEAPALVPSPWPSLPPRDDFDEPVLAPQWISVRRPCLDDEALSDRPGWLRLHGRGRDLDSTLPTFMGRRQQHHNCNVTVRIDAHHGISGLAIRMDERHHAEIVIDHDRLAVRARIGDLHQELASVPCPAGPIDMGVQIREGWGRSGPDTIQFGYRDTAGFVALTEMDGRYLSTEVAGGFTGRVIGVLAVDGVADVDWIEYVPAAADAARREPAAR
jgi:xylan 1,4-beta-xylosidase